MTFTLHLFSQESSIIDIWQCPKYACATLLLLICNNKVNTKIKNVIVNVDNPDIMYVCNQSSAGSTNTNTTRG